MAVIRGWRGWSQLSYREKGCLLYSSLVQVLRIINLGNYYFLGNVKLSRNNFFMISSTNGKLILTFNGRSTKMQKNCL
jgi:hypothetical protein